MSSGRGPEGAAVHPLEAILEIAVSERDRGELYSEGEASMLTNGAVARGIAAGPMEQELILARSEIGISESFNSTNRCSSIASKGDNDTENALLYRCPYLPRSHRPFQSSRHPLKVW